MMHGAMSLKKKNYVYSKLLYINEGF